jgi:hypothetical protein
MDLSQDIIKGINLLGDAKQIPDAAFKEITEFAFGVILNVVTEEKLFGTLWLNCDRSN